jgi:hypothetical protein
VAAGELAGHAEAEDAGADDGEVTPLGRVGHDRRLA